MAVMIILWFQGVYLLTEVEQNVAVIEMHSSLGWHSSGSAWECRTALPKEPVLCELGWLLAVFGCLLCAGSWKLLHELTPDTQVLNAQQ